jgi:hypothetical protein
MAIARFQKIFFYQVGHDLGVGFSIELVAFFHELSLKAEIVLDDAVVHHHDFAGAITVGMGILFGRAAVRGPAGVSNAVGTIQWLKADGLFQVAELAFGAADLQAVTFAGHSDSRRVIAAILQPPQSINDDGHNAFLANVTYDPAHGRDSLVVGRKRNPILIRCTLRDPRSITQGIGELIFEGLTKTLQSRGGWEPHGRCARFWSRH